MLGQKVAVRERIRTVRRVQPAAVVVKALHLCQSKERVGEEPLALLFAATIRSVEARAEEAHFRIQRKCPVERMPDERETEVILHGWIHGVHLGDARAFDDFSVGVCIAQPRYDAPRRHLGIAKPEAAVFSGDDLFRRQVRRAHRGVRHAPRHAKRSAPQRTGEVPDDERVRANCV